MILQDDFEAWLQNPVTLEVFAALKALGDGARQEWIAASWDGTFIDKDYRAALKAKEQTCKDLIEMSYEDFTEWQAKE